MNKSDRDLDPYLYRWLTKQASLRKLAIELNIPRSSVHILLLQRAKEIDPLGQEDKILEHLKQYAE